MNRNIYKYGLVLSAIGFLTLSCAPTVEPQVTPTLTTETVNTIMETSAKSGGSISSDAGSAIIARGVCWDTLSNPTIAKDKTMNGTGGGNFVSHISPIVPGKTYYVRAYATNANGTSYGNVQKFKALALAVNVVDADSNVYQTVNIGTQTWMVQNLKTTKYRTGESISNVTKASAWSSATFGAWCDYDNNPANGDKYGRLYNWAAIVDARRITPVGWHVATDAEWTTLINYLGGESMAAGKLKEAGIANWLAPNAGSTNESGFTALAGGERDPFGGFDSLGDTGYWWSTTENTNVAPSEVWFRYMSYRNNKVYHFYDDKRYGFSVRCMKDIVQ